jgi:hypothetical protein
MDMKLMHSYKNDRVNLTPQENTNTKYKLAVTEMPSNQHMNYSDEMKKKNKQHG